MSEVRMTITEALKKAVEMHGRGILGQERLLTALLWDLAPQEGKIIRLISHICNDHLLSRISVCREADIGPEIQYALYQMKAFYSDDAIRSIETVLLDVFLQPDIPAGSGRDEKESAETGSGLHLRNPEQYTEAYFDQFIRKKLIAISEGTGSENCRTVFHFARPRTAECYTKALIQKIKQEDIAENMFAIELYGYHPDVQTNTAKTVRLNFSDMCGGIKMLITENRFPFNEYSEVRENVKTPVVRASQRTDITAADDEYRILLCNLCKPGDPLPVTKKLEYQRNRKHMGFLITKNDRPDMYYSFDTSRGTDMTISLSVEIGVDGDVHLTCTGSDSHDIYIPSIISPVYIPAIPFIISPEEAADGYSYAGGNHADSDVRAGNMRLLHGDYLYEDECICLMSEDRQPLIARVVISVPDEWRKLGNGDVERTVDIAKYRIGLEERTAVDMLYGEKILLAIPEKAKEGYRLRIKGRGLPRYDGTKGICYLKIHLL